MWQDPDEISYTVDPISQPALLIFYPQYLECQTKLKGSSWHLVGGKRCNPVIAITKTTTGTGYGPVLGSGQRLKGLLLQKLTHQYSLFHILYAWLRVAEFLTRFILVWGQFRSIRTSKGVATVFHLNFLSQSPRFMGSNDTLLM